MDGFEIIRDQNIDKMLEEIIEIFKLEGVKLVRLSGMTKWCKKISGKNDLPKQAVDNIIRKMNINGIIKYNHIINCPHCGETSYVIEFEDDYKQKPKLCDTCDIFYALLEGATLETYNIDK